MGLDRARCDVRNAARVRQLIAELGPDAVVHSAGYTQVDRAEFEPHECLAVNSDAVASMADVCNALDARLVYISTDYVFGSDADSPRADGRSAAAISTTWLS